MCGICGHVGRAEEEVDPALARPMADVLRHRGPDGHGERSLDSARGDGRLRGWFGHRRLKILDLSDAAHQPMENADGTVVISYNGEIYNFRELRTELEAAGFHFTSAGDTEVVLRAYERWGPDFTSHLDGMFAVAVWDELESRLVLARDRTGKKPLFYTVADGRLTFASEIKGLLAVPWVHAEPDLSRVAELLTYGYVPNPHTMLRGVLQVPPASLVIFDADGARTPVTYWDAAPAEDPEPAGEQLAAEVAALVEAAVARRMVADVPLGALLSGGIDSSLVVGLMARHATEPILTFSIGFPEEPAIDESAYARRVAAHFGADHTAFAVEADAVGLLDTLLWHHDQPFADTSAIPTYIVCRLAREKVTVALNGDGGDEVFGGYRRFAATAATERIPRSLVRAGGAAARLVPDRGGTQRIRRRADRYFAAAGLPMLQRYQAWISVTSRELLDELLHEPGPATTAAMDRHYAAARSAPELDQVLYANLKTYLPDDLAVKMDRTSMASSLETRSPFLDTAVIERLARVRAADKVGLRRVKPLLRDAFGPLVPTEIWNRPKQGFGVPLGRWFRGELGERFADEVLARDARVADLLDQTVLRRIYDEHRAGAADHGLRLWTVLTLEGWLRSLERPPLPEAPSAPPLSASVKAPATVS